MQKKLRFHAQNAGSVLQRFQLGTKKCVLDLGVAVFGRPGRPAEDVAYNCFLSFVDRKAVAQDCAGWRVNGYQTGKNPCVQVLHEHLDGGCVVPLQTSCPLTGLLFQKETHLGAAEVAEISDFEVGPE